MSDGFRNMLHFVGVVEDAHDKTNSGRVRVRAFGIHPPRDSQDEQDFKIQEKILKHLIEPYYLYST